MPEIPDWLKAYMDYAAGVLGLDHLTLYYRLKRLGKAKGGRVGGEARSNWRYNFAHIDFDQEIEPDAWGYETATHEMLHVSMLPMARAVERILDLVPKRERAHALELWADGNEEAVTRLAHYLTPVLRAQMATKAEEGSTTDGEAAGVAERHEPAS
jgi:hypothetical protein